MSLEVTINLFDVPLWDIKGRYVCLSKSLRILWYLARHMTVLWMFKWANKKSNKLKRNASMLEYAWIKTSRRSMKIVWNWNVVAMMRKNLKINHLAILAYYLTIALWAKRMETPRTPSQNMDDNDNANRLDKIIKNVTLWQSMYIETLCPKRLLDQSHILCSILFYRV